MGAKEPQPARALYGASAYAAPRTPSPGRLRASPAAVATHHHLTPAGPSCLGWERPSDGRVRQTRVGSAFSGRFHTCYVRSCASAWRTRSGRASDPAWGGDGRGGRRRATARAAAPLGAYRYAPRAVPNGRSFPRCRGLHVPAYLYLSRRSVSLSFPA